MAAGNEDLERFTEAGIGGVSEALASTGSRASVSLVKQTRESRARKRTSAARSPRRPPVGFTRKLLRVDGKVVRLHLRPDRSHGAKMLYLCAVVVGLGTALLALWVDDEFWWGEFVPLMLLVLGLVFGLTDRETRLHFDSRLVFRENGDSVSEGIPFANLVGILALTRTALVHGGETSHEERRFVLGLLVADAAAPLHETLAAMRRDRVAAISRGRTAATHELSPRFEREMQAHMLVVVDYNDETAVWQVSEWLAKKLDLPLIDACSSPRVLRVPEELGLSLGERLARGLQPLQSIDGKAGVALAHGSVLAETEASVERQPGKCTLTWRQNRRFDLFMCLGTALVFPPLGLLFREDGLLFFWCFTAVSVCLLLLALNVARWHGVNQLTVDRKRVTVTRGPFGKRLRPFATDSLEAIRIGGTSGYPLLSLVSDERVLRILMPPPIAHWAKQHIERELLAVYTEKLKLEHRGE